jgi:hypothetical protein
MVADPGEHPLRRFGQLFDGEALQGVDQEMGGFLIEETKMLFTGN